MHMTLSQILGKEIFWKKRKHAQIAAIFFNPKNGRLTGIKAQSGLFFATQDILWQREGVSLQHNNPCSPKGRDILFLSLCNKKGDFLGIVRNVEFSDFSLINIHSARSFFGFLYSKKIFPLKRIHGITKDHIIVDDENTEPSSGIRIPSVSLRYPETLPQYSEVH